IGVPGAGGGELPREKFLEGFQGDSQGFQRRFQSGFPRIPAGIPKDSVPGPPLGLSGKGFWAEVLGVGDFYYELGVQIIEVCLALRHRNGGLITLEELQQQVLKGRGKFAQDVSADDLLRAIRKLKVLGSGFGIIPVGGTVLVQSVPAELSMDHTVVLQLLAERIFPDFPGFFPQKKGFVTVSEIRDSLKWETERAKQVTSQSIPSHSQFHSHSQSRFPHFFPFFPFFQDHLLKEGMAWLDAQAPAEPQFWLPALFSELHGQDGT
uniref:Vacuolar-sorting protein SNF8 n=1 Tax=Junco hyemalis TaxID=40217 RepID=A0A8C5IXA3_JUNHY